MEKLFNKYSTAFIFITILTIIALIYGFSTIPSPSAEQDTIADQQRVVDLGELVSSINTYFQNNNQLPKSLSILTDNTDDPGAPLEKSDPLTKKAYGYQITDLYQGTYNLCATFTHKSPKTNNDTGILAFSLYSSYSDQFIHPAGYFCFSENQNGGGGGVGTNFGGGGSGGGGVSDTAQPVPTTAPMPSTGVIAPTDMYLSPSPATPTPEQNPTANDTVRESDVNAILNAIDQYAASNAGSLPQDIVALPVNTPKELNTANFPTLCSQLVPTYLAALPSDPDLNNGSASVSCSGMWDTGYHISKDATNTITISAPDADAGSIQASR